MNLEDWLREYERIRSDLSLSHEADRQATLLMDTLVRGRAQALQELREAVRGRYAIVFGAGPSLEEGLERAIQASVIGRCVKVVADGAVTALMERAVLPEVNVTDLDGDLDDIVKANRRGTITVVHAHGDNMETLKKVVPRLGGRVVATTQVEPTERVQNFYGFTDGDRALSLVLRLGAADVCLVGMDFGAVMGRYSKPGMRSHYPAAPRKARKLQIAERLARLFAEEFGKRLYTVEELAEKMRAEGGT